MLKILFLVFFGLVSLVPVAWTQQFDLVILNGRVMDPETDFDAVRNVGVKDGIIVSITKDEISGSESIDATGHVVSPGFIDTHHHSAGNPFGVKLGLRDGITTPLDLEVGALNADAYYAEREGKWPVNYGMAVSHEFNRMRVLDNLVIDYPAHGDHFAALRSASYEDNDIPDWAETPTTLEQMNEMLEAMDKDLQAGALGIASTTGYMANGITTLELFNVQKVAANYGRLYASHVRLLGNNSPPAEATLGAFEQIANGVALNQPLILSHNNNFAWWEVEEHLQLLRAQGYNVWSEYYPYTCGSSTIGSDFIKPENIGGLGLDYTNLIDPRTGDNMNREIYDEIVAEDPAYIIILCLPDREEWLPMWLKVPHMTVAGDQMPPVDEEGNLLGWDDPYEKYNGHPRTAGTHAKVLRLAREHDIPLMHTIAQQSYWSAKHLGDAGIEAMQVRGRMQEGMVADITIFDPENATDNADYAIGTNGLPSTGIPWVIVNGTIVVKNSKVLDNVFPGQPIRYAVESEGRFNPLEKQSYLENLLSPADIPAEARQHGAGPQANAVPAKSSYDPLVRSVNSEDNSAEKSEWFTGRETAGVSHLDFCPVHMSYEDRSKVFKDIRLSQN